MPNSNELTSAVCIVSGGLDSICAASYVANEKKKNIYMISYVYGQRSRYEIEIAKRFAYILKAKEHIIIDIEFLKNLYGGSNILTGIYNPFPKEFSQSLIVPIRNMIFITIASAWALSNGSDFIAYGAHTNDYNYPDCRSQFIQKITEAINQADIDAINLKIRNKITVWAPAVEGLSKADLINYGYKNLHESIFKTWSCYSDGEINDKGERIHCGMCESCINRKNAFKVANIEDQTEYAKI